MKYYGIFNKETNKLSRGIVHIDNENDLPQINENEVLVELEKEQVDKSQMIILDNGKVVLDQEKVNSKRKNEIYFRLSGIDIEALRPLRAVALGNAVNFDTEKLEALEKEANELRLELKDL